MHGSSITVIHSGTGITWALAAVSILVTIMAMYAWSKLDDRVRLIELQDQSHERRINKIEAELIKANPSKE